MFEIEQLRAPLVVAPMAGGPSTPALAAAVADFGALGFLAGGNLSGPRFIEQVERLKTMTGEPFGVNVFVPTIENDAEGEIADRSAMVAAYRLLIEPDAARYGVTLPEVNAADSDDWSTKIEYLLENPVAVVSFTFGLPDRRVFDRLHTVGTHVTVTVTDEHEAVAAAEQGADSLAVQGPLAGGHRGTHEVAKQPSDLSLDELLASIVRVTDLPLIAAGGVSSRERVAALLDSGASAAQIGTMFLRSPESGASDTYKTALGSGRYTTTSVTRAFTGRFARGLANRFLLDHDADAVAAYPEINLLTRQLRAASATAGDPEAMSLWAGIEFAKAPALPAREILAMLTPGK